MKMYENKLSDLHNCERSHAGVHTRRHFLLTHTHAGYTVHIPLTHKKSPVVGGRSEVANTSAGAEFLWRGQVLIATTCWHYLDTGLALCPCGKESLLGRANDDKFCRHSWSPGPALGIFAKSRWTGKRSRESTVKIKTSIAVMTPRRASSSRSWDASGDRASRAFHSCFICFIRLSFVFHSFHWFHSCFIRAISVIPKAQRLGENLRHGRGKEGKERGKERGKSPGSNFARKAHSNPRRNARATDAFYGVKQAGSSSSKSMSFFFSIFSFFLFSFFFLCFFFLHFFAFLLLIFFRLFLSFFVLFTFFFLCNLFFLPSSFSGFFFGQYLFLSFLEVFSFSFSHFVLFLLSCFLFPYVLSFCIRLSFSLFLYILFFLCVFSPFFSFFIFISFFFPRLLLFSFCPPPPLSLLH